jgi:hypothetical protein
MAKRATKDAVEMAVNGPDFEAALSIINGRIENAKSAQGKAGKDAAAAWASIEKMGVNKAGAMMFNRVAKIEDDAELQDQMRTFFALCKLEGIDLQKRDLMDMAQEQSAPAPSPAPAAAAPKPDAPQFTEQETEQLADGAPKGASEKLAENPKPTRKPPTLKVVSPADAKKAAQGHLGTDKTAAPDATD